MIWQSVYLLLAIGATYFFTQQPSLSIYTLQLIALLVVVYFGGHFVYKKKEKVKGKQVLGIDLVILTVVILLLVTETGGLGSPLMFTVYLLLLAVGLLMEMEVVLVLTVVLAGYFVVLPSTQLTNLLQLSELVSLLLMGPLAMVVAYLQEERLKAEWHLGREETEVVTFVSLVLKPFLLRSLDRLSEIIPQVGGQAGEKLRGVYEEMREVWRKAEEFEEDIDRETD